MAKALVVGDFRESGLDRAYIIRIRLDDLTIDQKMIHVRLADTVLEHAI